MKAEAKGFSTFGIIRNSILLYRKHWKEIGMPFYMMIITGLIYALSIFLNIIPCLGAIIDMGIGIILGIINLGIIFIALKPIYAALKNKTIPDWKQADIRNVMFKSAIFYMFEYGITLLIIIPLFGIIISILLLNIIPKIDTTTLIIFSAALIIIIAILVTLALLWIKFTMFEYVINKKGLKDSIKLGINLYKNNFIKTIIFNIILWITNIIFLIPLYIFYIILFIGLSMMTTNPTGISSSLGSYTTANIVLLLLKYGIIVLFSLISIIYKTVFITPWVMTAQVDFWDKLKSKSKPKSKGKGKNKK